MRHYRFVRTALAVVALAALTGSASAQPPAV